MATQWISHAFAKCSCSVRKPTTRPFSRAANVGMVAGVVALLVCEYAFRRWHLPHVDHISLPVFMTRLVRRWPALARSVMNDTAHRGAS